MMTPTNEDDLLPADICRSRSPSPCACPRDSIHTAATSILSAMECSFASESPNSSLDSSMHKDDDENDHHHELLEVSSVGSASESSVDSELAPDGPQDKMFSLYSNLFFLAGACIQSVVAAWEVRDAIADAAGYDDDDDDGGSSSDDDDDPTIYYILNCLGPFLFILNALVDTQWALYLPSNHSLAARRCSLLQYCLRWNKSTPTLADGDDENASTSTSSSSSSSESSLQQDVHDRVWDLTVAVIFGLGATLEFTSTVFSFAHLELDSDNLNVIAMHTYLISGLLHIFKERRIVLNPGGSLARKLMGCGMILFFSGSLLDCIMSYLFDPNLVSASLITPVVLAWANLSSSLLWNVNAVFFVWADCIVYGVVAKCRQAMRRTCCKALRKTCCCCCGRQRSSPALRDALPDSLSLPLLQNVVDVSSVAELEA